MKKNIIIIVLCIIIVGLLAYIVYDKTNSNDLDSNANSNSIQQNSDTITMDSDSDSDSDTSKQENLSVEEVFNSFVKKHNLTTNNEGYDFNALKSINCENAVNAYDNGYSLELLTFNDVDSAKVEYQKQVDYQNTTSNQKELLSSISNDNYDIFEAILVPDLENAPAAKGDEVEYILQLRKDNYFIVLFQISTDDDKTAYISLAKELKEMLNIK